MRFFCAGVSLLLTIFLINPNKEKYFIVHHISGNHLDNKAKNLLYVTCEQHTMIHGGSRKICSSYQNKYDEVGGCPDECFYCNPLIFENIMAHKKHEHIVLSEFFCI